MSELRIIHNDGPTIFVDAYAGVQYLVEPGKTAMVPSEAIDLWFGDNTLVNTPIRARRKEEFARLRTRWGLDVSDIDPDIANTFPNISVTTLDGETVGTVMDDPEGDKVHAAVQTIDEQSRMLSLIEAQRRDLAQLQEQYKSLLRERAATEASDMEVDQPQTPPSKRAQGKGTKVVDGAIHGDVPVDARA